MRSLRANARAPDRVKSRTKPASVCPSRAGTPARRREAPRGRFRAARRFFRFFRRRPTGARPLRLRRSRGNATPTPPPTSRGRHLSSSPSSGRRRSSGDSRRRARRTIAPASQTRLFGSRRTKGGPCRSGPAAFRVRDIPEIPETRIGSARPHARTPAPAPRRSASTREPSRPSSSRNAPQKKRLPKSQRPAAENAPRVGKARRSPERRRVCGLWSGQSSIAARVRSAAVVAAPTCFRRRAPRRARRARRTRASPLGTASGVCFSVSRDALPASASRFHPASPRLHSRRCGASRKETPARPAARLGVSSRCPEVRRPGSSSLAVRRRRPDVPPDGRRRPRQTRIRPRRTRTRTRNRSRSPAPRSAATRTRSRAAKRPRSSGSTPRGARTRRGTGPRRERGGISRRRASPRSRWTPSGARPLRRGTRSTRRTRVPRDPPGRRAEATRGSNTSGRTRGRTRGSDASWSPG